jgi:ABC-type antimicrobial peptide transport system permease subunit
MNYHPQSFAIELVGVSRKSLFLRRALVLTAAGMAAGIVGAVAVTHTMRGLLYRTSALDPITFTAVVAVLALVALAAGYIPARRAITVDPAITLRSE